MDKEATSLVRITKEAKQALDLLAASKQVSKVDAASEAIIEAWRLELERLANTKHRN